MVALALLSASAMVALTAVTPSAAGAYATPAPGPEPGAAGLPDGRVYEQVTPPDKSGYQAGVSNSGVPPVMKAAANGNGVLFNDSGPIGSSATGVQNWTVAKRSGTGWQDTGMMPRALGAQSGIATVSQAFAISADFSTIVFEPVFNGGGLAPYVAGENSFEGGLLGVGDPAIFEHEVGSPVTNWLGSPTIAKPHGDTYSPGEVRGGYIAGASSDLSTDYFGFSGTLTPEDGIPNPSLGNVSRAAIVAGESTGGNDPGFYEWHDGQLSAAGVLPDGSLDPYGAVPATTTAAGPNRFTGGSLQNQVSETGAAAFFVSPAPESGSGRTPELYVRETAADGTQRTSLVSRDALLPDVNGLPAPAPKGPAQVESLLTSQHARSYMYASPDGSRVFFTSTDRLTAAAPEDESGKFYEFQLATEELKYLPGIDLPSTEAGGPAAAQVLASTPDGSSFLFEKLAPEKLGHGYEPVELDLFTNGQVVAIAPLSAEVEVADTTPTGSVFVFQTAAEIPGFNDSGPNKSTEVFRYEAGAGRLSCISCTGPGVVPTQSAVLANSYTGTGTGAFGSTGGLAFADRGVSSDGTRVIFDTPEKLVPQAINGVRDVYEWEKGKLYLISSGTNSEPSYFGDISEDGNDIFFLTAQGLVAGDTDGAYDAYDARVPRAGDSPPASATPCEGEACQGPPSVPQLLGPPASATFSGLGNPPPASVPAATSKSKPKRAPKKCKKRRTLKHGKCVERKAKKPSRKGRS
ncbi:MAG TPA: hypothetical protein VII53_04200 [Solirubrobacteraceae bacterium]